MEQEKKTLVSKLAKIMGGIDGVPKTGRNNFHKYNYTTEADVQAITSNRMAEENLIMIPYEVEGLLKEVTTNKGNKENFYQGTWDFHVMDGDSGEQITVRVTGHGQDSGDKAPYKAFTGAHKYALMKLFQISTGDDPERNNHENDNQNNNQQPAQPQDDFGTHVNELADRVKKLAAQSGQDYGQIHKVMLQRTNAETGNQDSNITRDNLAIYNKQLRLAETNFNKQKTQKEQAQNSNNNTQSQDMEQGSFMQGNTTNVVNWGQ